MRYYRCTNLQCNAKKQVERTIDELETLVVNVDSTHTRLREASLPAASTPCL